MATTSTRMQLTILLVLVACFLVLASTEKTMMSKTRKSCKTTLGLCAHDCLTGCCNDKCSKKFKHGTGKCLEPIMPVASCLCQYTC
uniref:Defensin-like protein n=1 Tax=Tanacetum cinerariifolium TaxID=118510 RepID=A0A699KPP6_TANCI|nr:hypothetical protein [Tanacetum cinerariifolium]